MGTNWSKAKQQHPHSVVVKCLNLNACVNSNVICILSVTTSASVKKNSSHSKFITENYVSKCWIVESVSRYYKKQYFLFKEILPIIYLFISIWYGMSLVNDIILLWNIS